MSSPVISPELQELYNYDFDQDDEKVQVKFITPIDFSWEGHKLLFQDTRDISFRISDNMPPLLEGKLIEPVTSVVFTVDDSNNGTLTLTKERKVEWPVLILGLNPQTSNIDPQSAYYYYQVMSDDDQTSSTDTGYRMLLIAVTYQFVPAMRSFATLCLQEPDTQKQGMLMLQRLAGEFKDSIAHYQLATILIHSPEGIEQGIMLYEQLADRYNPACLQLGLLYSPYSKLYSPHKDAGKALEYLRKVTQGGFTAIALHEIAMIYHRGAPGVAPQPASAQLFQEEAESIDPKVPKLDELPAIINERAVPKEAPHQEAEAPQEEKASTFPTALAAMAAAGVAITCGWIFWRSRRGH